MVSAGWLLLSAGFSCPSAALHSRLVINSSFFILVSPCLQWTGSRRLSGPIQRTWGMGKLAGSFQGKLSHRGRRGDTEVTRDNQMSRPGKPTPPRALQKEKEKAFGGSVLLHLAIP